MNGGDTEKLTGISRRNLHFYEEQSLIEPNRNPDNGYRDYSEKDIEKLKMIRGVRTLDVPLELIGDYFKGKVTLTELSAAQEQRLINKQKEIETALNICKELQTIEELKGNTVNTLLEKMDELETKKNLFDEWKKDYKLASELAKKEFFYFYPEKAVETAKDMTAALCHYANVNGYQLEIIKEGLNPEFILNGITYTASSSNGSNNLTSNVFYPEICCEAKDPSFIYNKPLTKKQKVLKFLSSYAVFPSIIFIVVMFYGGGIGVTLFSVWKFWVILIGSIGLTVIANYFLKHNSFLNKTRKKEDKQ